MYIYFVFGYDTVTFSGHVKLSYRVVSYRVVNTTRKLRFLADSTNGRAYATVLRLSVCPSVCRL